MKKTITILVSVLLLSLPMTGTCFADITGENGKTIPAATINIPITHKTIGDKYNGDKEFEYIFASVDPDNPMPPGSAGGVCMLAGDKTVYAGPILFEHPEEYVYTVSRDVKNTEEWKYDKTTYRVQVVKTNTSAVYVTIWNTNSGNKVNEIVYTDEHIDPSVGKRISPKTGESAEVLMYSALFASAVIGVFSACFIRSARKKNMTKEREEEYETK